MRLQDILLVKQGQLIHYAFFAFESRFRPSASKHARASKNIGTKVGVIVIETEDLTDYLDRKSVV